MGKDNGSQARWEFDVDRISVEDVENFLNAVKGNKLTEQAAIMAKYVQDAPVEAVSAEGLAKMPFKEFLRGRDQFSTELGDLAKN